MSVFYDMSHLRIIVSPNNNASQRGGSGLGGNPNNNPPAKRGLSRTFFSHFYVIFSFDPLAQWSLNPIVKKTSMQLIMTPTSISDFHGYFKMGTPLLEDINTGDIIGILYCLKPVDFMIVFLATEKFGFKFIIFERTFKYGQL